MVGVSVLAGVGGAIYFGHQPTTPTQSQTSSLSPGPVTDIQHSVDVAVGQTMVAAARLDAFDDADPARQTTILTRAQQNITAAQQSLTALSQTPAAEVAKNAHSELGRLSTVIDGLEKCLTEETARPTHHSPMSRRSSTARALCSVTAEEVAVARAAGSSVGALTEYGAATTADLAELSRTVQEQARREGQAGSTATVTVPDAYQP